MKKKNTDLINKILLFLCCVFLAFILWCVVKYDALNDDAESTAMVLSQIKLWF